LDLFSLIDADAVTDVLSQAAQADLTSKLVIVGIVWKVMGKKVAAHFNSMETAVKGVATEVKDLREAVQKDLQAQSARLALVEDGLTTVKADIQLLRSQTPQGGA
jgi:transcription termination factor NusB